MPARELLRYHSPDQPLCFSLPIVFAPKDVAASLIFVTAHANTPTWDPEHRHFRLFDALFFLRFHPTAF
jgi:hypothetical protein